MLTSKVSQIFPNVATKVPLAVFKLKVMVLEIALKSPYIWASFVIKLSPKSLKIWSHWSSFKQSASKCHALNSFQSKSRPIRN